MNKVEFSDLYKFLTSMGLLFMALPFVVLWSTINSMKEIDVDTLSSLPPNVKEYISTKQSFFIKYGDGILIGVFIVGILLFCFGIYSWNERQKKNDQKQDIELDELMKSMTSVPEEEKEQSIGREIVQEEIAESDIEETIQANGNPRVPRPPYRGEAKKEQVSKYRDIENQVISVVKSSALRQMKIRENVRVGNVEFDLFLKGKDKFIFVEIKYYSKKIFYSFLSQGLDNFISNVRRFSLSSKIELSRFELVMVWVYSDRSQYEKIIDYSKRCEGEASFQGINLKIHCVHEEEIQDTVHFFNGVYL